jgi:hypothetical protein
VLASLYAGKPNEEHNSNPKIIKDQPIYAVLHYYVLTPQRVQALQPYYVEPFQLRVSSKGPDLPTAEPNIVAGKSKGAKALWLMPVILGAADADDVRNRISDMMRVGVLTPKIQTRANYASLHMHKLNVFPCGFALPLFHTQKESDFVHEKRGATAEDDPFTAIIRKRTAYFSAQTLINQRLKPSAAGFGTALIDPSTAPTLPLMQALEQVRQHYYARYAKVKTPSQSHLSPSAPNFEGSTQQRVLRAIEYDTNFGREPSISILNVIGNLELKATP